MTNKTISELDSAILSDGLAMVVEGVAATQKTTVGELKTYVGNGKQDTLVAGENITIEGNVISATGGSSITVDDAMSESSENPVQNKVITAALADKADTSSLATVATSGSYTDLINKPVIPEAQIQVDWNQADSEALDYIKNKPSIPAGQVQADWEQVDTEAVDYIKNKPTIPVVDQVYDSSSTHAQSGIAVESAIAAAISSTYKPAGSADPEHLPALIAANEGKVYDMSADFETTADFVEGAGKSYPAGTNIVIINTGTTQIPVYKYDVLSSFIDLSDYATIASLATVATSGSYTDLINKPVIPTVNNATLTITQNGTTKGTFTANAGTDASIDLIDRYKGIWNSTATYAIGDIVKATDDVAYYICNIAGSDHSIGSGYYDSEAGKTVWYWSRIDNTDYTNYLAISNSETNFQYSPVLSEPILGEEGKLQRTRLYRNGPTFKRTSHVASTATATQTVGSSLSDITVNVSNLELEFGLTTDTTIVFTYNGEAWEYNSDPISSIYPNIITYTGTPDANDEVTITYTASVDKYLLSKTKCEGLVTSLTAQSTDDQYPSAKCVYDIIGDLESILASI